MAIHASSQPGHPRSPEAGDVRDVRSLQRSYINLSQATTLVGSESDDDDYHGSTTAAATSAAPRHGTVGGLQSRGSGVQCQTDVNAVSSLQTTAEQEASQRIREKAVAHFKALQAMPRFPKHLPIDLSAMMEVAEQLSEAGKCMAAQGLYERTLQTA
jgi:hypothetical protein